MNSTSQDAGDDAQAKVTGLGALPFVSATSDLALFCAPDGRVADVVWNIEGADDADIESLKDVALEDTVTEECRPKIRQMLMAADQGEPPRWREINHLIKGVGELPVRHQAIRIDDHVVFMGRELRAVAQLQSRLVAAQRALDEDYDRLRQMQTQYRVLFQTSSEPFLIVDGQTLKIREANEAAARLLGLDMGDLPGMALAALLGADARARFEEVLPRIVSSGQSEIVSGRSENGGERIDCRMTLFRGTDSVMLLCTLSRCERLAEGPLALKEMLSGMVGQMPDAVVLTDRLGAIIWCNDAFLGMAEVVLAGQAHGKPLADFISCPGVDLGVIIENAARNGYLRALSLILLGAYGSETPIEVSVAVLGDGATPVIGFVIRDVSRRDHVPVRANGAPRESADSVMKLVGTRSLKDIVRASTEEIEKICIEGALRKTENNRASAASMLGLSRQSLYVKLRQFDLLDFSGGA